MLKFSGSLDAPDLSFYYIANQIQYLAKWNHQTTHNIPLIDLLQLYCKNISLLNLPFVNTTIKQYPCCYRQLYRSERQGKKREKEKEIEKVPQRNTALPKDTKTVLNAGKMPI